MIEVPLSTVTAFRVVAPEFKPRPVMEVKQALLAEFGTAFEVAIRGQSVVCAPRGKADAFAILFDQTKREFLQYLKVRRFVVSEPDLPLIAVVYSTRAEFDARCIQDGVTPAPALRGYYSQRSNRVTLVDAPPATNVAGAPAETASLRVPSVPGGRPLQSNAVPGEGDDAARETAIHEAIHQVAFNCGLHSRVGGNPLWVVEGLAMQFERGSSGYRKTRTSARVNLPRLKTVDAFRQNGRPEGTLAELIASDDLFKRSPLPAYGEAWLLTNYLMETRQQKYGWYLQTLAARDPLKPYPPEERLQDFMVNFKEDLAWMEVEYLRYAEKMAAEALDEEGRGSR